MKKSALTTWDPFRELGHLQNRLAGLLSGREGESTLGFPDTDWSPAVDIKEDEKTFTITADLPDVKKENVDVVVENGVLSFSGTRSTEAEEKDEKKTFHRIERSSGSYMRRFQLPEGVNEQDVSASYRDGVLTISLPKVPREEPRKVSISVG